MDYNSGDIYGFDTILQSWLIFKKQNILIIINFIILIDWIPLYFDKLQIGSKFRKLSIINPVRYIPFISDIKINKKFQNNIGEIPTYYKMIPISNVVWYYIG